MIEPGRVPMAHGKSFVFLMLLLSCSFYSYWLSSKDYEWVVPHLNDRTPASIRGSTDLQNIFEKPMRVYKRDTVVSSISIGKTEGRAFFSMGQFPVSSTEGTNLVCLEYPYLKLKFVGEGASVNGKKAVAWIKAPCKINEKNKDFLSNIPLPFGDLQRLPAQNQEMNYSMLDLPLRVQFEQIFGVWPNLWQLDAIEFSKDESETSDRIVLDNYEFLQKLGEPVFVK
jgi:hypothetical protein